MKAAAQIVISTMFVLLAVTVALPRLKRQSQGYVLPAGADLLFSQVRSTFTCENRQYGYYADVDNECHIFHVCVPKEGFVTTTPPADGNNNNNQQKTHPTQQTPYQFSFFCPNQTVFSQADFVCMFPDEAAPCEDSESLYNLNERFGQTNDSQSSHARSNQSAANTGDAQNNVNQVPANTGDTAQNNDEAANNLDYPSSEGQHDEQ